MRRAALLLALAACGKKDAAPSAPPPAAVHDAAVAAVRSTDAAPPAALVPEVTFAVEDLSDGVSVYRTGPRGIQLVHRAQTTLGQDAIDLAWTAPDALFVRFEDDSVAGLRGDALARIPLPPARTWRVRPAPDEQKLGFVSASLVASGSELWLGECQWGSTDGEETSCDEWAWARIAPAPVIVKRAAPPQAPDLDPPSASPSPSVVAEVVPERMIDGAPGDDAPRPRGILRCTTRGATIEYPPADAREGGFEGMGEIRWLSTDPPLMTVEQIFPTYDSSVREPVLFAGCTPVAHAASLQVGPDGVLALVDDGNASVWWRGRELGRVPADLLAFAPAPR